MGIFEKFKLGLSKSSKNLSSGLNNLIFKKNIEYMSMTELPKKIKESYSKTED